VPEQPPISTKKIISVLISLGLNQIEEMLVYSRHRGLNLDFRQAKKIDHGYLS